MTLRNIFSWTAVFLWMLLIFSFSAQPAAESGEFSQGITETVIEIIEKIPGIVIDTDSFHYFIRKAAHFSVYFMLGLLVMNALRAGGRRGRKAYISAIIFCVLYAVSDEVHQSFVPGRAAQLTDIMIDSVGVLLSNGLYFVTHKEQSDARTNFMETN